MHLRFNSTQCNEKESDEITKEVMQLMKPYTTNIDHHLDNYGKCYSHHQADIKVASTKRFILWLILLVQIGFMICFWLMQLGVNDKLKETSAANLELDNRITFVQSKALEVSRKREVQNIGLPETKHFQWRSRDFKFQNDFLLHEDAFNISEDEKLMFGKPSLWCFREGTLNSITQKSVEWNYSNPWQRRCECLPEWHGRDCGQPEVIWRALLMAKIPLKLKDPTREEAHRLVYMLEGNFLNLDLMELQVKAVSKVVDYFIVYMKRKPINSKDLKATKFRLKQMLPLKNFFLYHCKLLSYKNCSSAEAYRLFRQQQLPTNAIKPTDIFIYTNDETILGHRALNFLKYYFSDIAPVLQFRLKFNVFGFYWQHPKQTHLSGLISSFQRIDNSDANPTLLQKYITSQHQQEPSLVIGDLNHFGGWICKYCQEADEIVNELQLSQSSLNSHEISPLISIQHSVVFPSEVRHSSIDAAYVQQLISMGVYLTDGKTPLQKVRRLADKYYAPQYASEQSWKYGRLLINIYESLEDLSASDNEDEMF